MLENARLVYADGAVVDGGLIARDGVISEVFAGDPPGVPDGAETIDAGGRHVLPGLIDPHVQLYPQPDWAHYATETRFGCARRRDDDREDAPRPRRVPAGRVRAEVAGAEIAGARRLRASTSP